MMRWGENLFFVINLNLGENNQAGTQLLKKVENGTRHEKGWEPLLYKNLNK